MQLSFICNVYYLNVITLLLRLEVHKIRDRSFSFRCLLWSKFANTLLVCLLSVDLRPRCMCNWIFQLPQTVL